MPPPGSSGKPGLLLLECERRLELRQHLFPNLVEVARFIGTYESARILPDLTGSALRALPPIASGEKLAAFAVTEANAGSDAGGIQTTANRDGDYYVLNGTKQWITNAGEAEIYAVVALTDRAKGPRGASVLGRSSKFYASGFHKHSLPRIESQPPRQFIIYQQRARIPTLAKISMRRSSPAYAGNRLVYDPKIEKPGNAGPFMVVV